MNWARMVRGLCESTSGSILPIDVEEMTLDQVLICTLPERSLCSTATFSPEEVVAMGLIQTTGKSKVQEVLEQQAAEQAKTRRRQRRRRK